MLSVSRRARLRKESSRARIPVKRLVAIIVIVAAGIAAYVFHDPVSLLFARRERADLVVLERAIDSVYTLVDPQKLSSSVVELGAVEVGCDHLELGRDVSLVRTNLAITRAVEKAGGEILYGLESIDGKRRWQSVTLGVSDGDSLIREIRLQKRVR
jgi:hypothetical protein